MSTTMSFEDLLTISKMYPDTVIFAGPLSGDNPMKKEHMIILVVVASLVLLWLYHRNQNMATESQ